MQRVKYSFCVICFTLCETWPNSGVDV